MDPRTAPKHLQTLATWLLGQSSLQGHRLIAERMAALQVGHRSQYALLTALAESGPTSQADLGRRIGLDRSDVTAAIAELEARGLVDRTPDPADRRRNLVRITDSGTEFLAVMDGEVAAAQDELLAPLSTAERERLLAMLTRIVEHHAGPSGHDG
jgi:DNA-binding MarR family transcriptional regulator